MLDQLDFYIQVVEILAALLTLTSFLMLGQSRLMRLVGIFVVQGLLLTSVTAFVARSMELPHLYISAGLSFALKTIFIPAMLFRLITRMQLHREMDTVDHPVRVMIGGVALVVFSYYVCLPIVKLSDLLTLNTIAVSLAMILLGMLLMITRRHAVAQVIGFMSIENGLFFSAVVSTLGMPMVVELGIAFDVLIAAVIFGVFFFHIRSSIDSLDIDSLSQLNEVEQ